MKITAQEEYGLRCILQLAAQPPGEQLTVGEIARREGLSVAYVEKLLRILARAGLVRSQRGTKGGYEMMRPCDQISLGQVARALGGVQSSQEICERHTGNLSACIHEGSCDLRPVWQGVVDYVLDAMDAISLAQILEKGSLDKHLIMVRLPVLNAEAA
jgi:Rrf2 family protein